MMTRKTYLKKIFDGEADFCGKLTELHKAYLRIELSRGGRKRALSAADAMDDEARNAAGERARVLNEIERLSGICGSVTKAVKTMRGGTYSARMKGVSDATWRKYYYDWQSAKRRRQLLKHSRPRMIGDGINAACEPVNGANDIVNPPNDMVNPPSDTVNSANDIVNLPNDIVKCVRGNANDTVKSLIVQNPGITAVRMIEILNRSSSTVRRAIASLMKSGCIEHRGSDKTGGYYAIAESAPEQR